MRHAVPALLLAVTLPSPVEGQAASAAHPDSAAAVAAAIVDSVIAEHFADSAPGISVLVTRRGKLLFERVHGLAELETGRHIAGQTPFYLASVTKPFTAAATAALVEQGRLSLDAKAADLVAGWPVELKAVRVRHLLTHTSGVPDYYGFLQWRAFRGLDNAGVLDTLRAHPQPEFPAGERFAYSNSNYVVLAEIIEAVTGLSYSRALDQLVLRPAGARGVFVHDSPRLHAPERAFGYREAEGRFVPMDYMARRQADGGTVPLGFATVGAGGLYATGAGVAAFTDALFDGAVAGNVAIDSLVPGGLMAAENEDGCHYGFGWWVCERAGGRFLWHGGAFVGFSSAVVHARDERVTVVVLTNLAGAPAREIAMTLAERIAGVGN